MGVSVVGYDSGWGEGWCGSGWLGLCVGGSGFNLFRCWRMVMVIGNGCGDFCFLISEILGCCSGSFGGCW